MLFDTSTALEEEIAVCTEHDARESDPNQVEETNGQYVNHTQEYPSREA